MPSETKITQPVRALAIELAGQRLSQRKIADTIAEQLGVRISQQAVAQILAAADATKPLARRRRPDKRSREAPPVVAAAPPEPPAVVPPPTFSVGPLPPPDEGAGEDELTVARGRLEQCRKLFGAYRSDTKATEFRALVDVETSLMTRVAQLEAAARRAANPEEDPADADALALVIAMIEGAVGKDPDAVPDVPLTAAGEAPSS